MLLKLTTKIYTPRARARMAGVFEALEGFTSSFGQVFILGSLVVAGNPAVTAANILAHQQKFWLGFTLSLLGVIFHIIWVLLFYHLFKPVNKILSLLAAFVGILVCALQAVTSLLYVSPLLVLEKGQTLSAFTTEQLQSLALFFIKLNGYAFEVDLVFRIVVFHFRLAYFQIQLPSAFPRYTAHDRRYRLDDLYGTALCNDDISPYCRCMGLGRNTFAVMADY